MINIVNLGFPAVKNSCNGLELRFKKIEQYIDKNLFSFETIYFNEYDTFSTNKTIFDLRKKYEKIDFIHLNAFAHLSVAKKLKEHFNCKTIFNIEVYFEFYQHAYALTQCDAGMFPSNIISTKFKKYNDNCFTIYNGVEEPSIERIDLPSTNKKTKLLFLGRPSYQKNIDTFLQCDLSDFDVYIVGQNDSTLKLNNLPQNIFYLGKVQHEDISKYINSVDAIILPSRFEPFGIAAIEALKHKKILLSSFVDGMGEYLNDDCAINCGITIESINEALNKLKLLTTKEQYNYIENGYNIANNFNWQTEIKKLEEIYKRMG